MIEYFLSSVSKEQAVPYALAIGAIVLAVVLGYLLGHQDQSVVCGDYIIQVERQTKKAQELNAKLTECESKKAGGCVLKCGSICDQQIQKALDNHKAILCED